MTTELRRPLPQRIAGRIAARFAPRFAPRLTQWLTGRWHAWRVVCAVLIIAGLTVAAMQGYAWYQWRAGEDALARYQTPAACAHLQACLRIWPHSPTAHLLLARAERRAGRLESAQEHLDLCHQYGGTDLADELAFEWALLRATQGDLLSVEEPLQARLLRRPAEAPLIWEALAEGYRHTCRMPDARACLDEWLHMDPNNAHAYFLRGEVHRNVGALSRARDEYQHVVELDPGHDQARRLLVRCLVKLGRYDDAAGHLQRLCDKEPGDPELETLRARCAYDLGRRDDANARLDALLRQHPDYGPALRERGRFLEAAGDFSAAAQWLEQAAQALPYDYDCHWALQRVLASAGRTEEALKRKAYAQLLKDRLERISDITSRQMNAKPFDAALHCELGTLLIDVGQQESAERWLTSALQLQPGLPAAHTALAALYEQRGDTAQAAQHRRLAARAAAK